MSTSDEGQPREHPVEPAEGPDETDPPAPPHDPREHPQEPAEG